MTHLRRSFVAFHLTLGLVIFYLSVRTVLQGLGLHHGAHDLHEVVIGGIEAVGALLFLVPRTLRVGGAMLLFTFLVATIAHAARGEFPAPILVYAVGTIFVMVHGSAWQPRSRVLTTP